MNLELAKTKVERVWNKAKNFYEKHKETINWSLGTGIAVLTISTISYQNELIKYANENKKLNLKINQLVNKIHAKNRTISCQYTTIKSLAGAGTQAGSSKCASVLRSCA